MQPGISILTPTEGVNFNPYVNRLLTTLKRNWYSVMPESALFGAKGIVVITFQIQHDGTIPPNDPILERKSSREDFDAAALSAIRTSAPFEPLPAAFKAPNIEFRVIFYYDLPADWGESPRPYPPRREPVPRLFPQTPNLQHARAPAFDDSFHAVLLPAVSYLSNLKFQI